MEKLKYIYTVHPIAFRLKMEGSSLPREHSVGPIKRIAGIGKIRVRFGGDALGDASSQPKRRRRLGILGEIGGFRRRGMDGNENRM